MLIDCKNHIARLKSCFLGHLGVDRIDVDRSAGALSEEEVQTAAAFRVRHARPRLPADIALVHQLLRHAGCGVDRNGEAQSFHIGACGFRDDKANELSVPVKESAAGIARVDRAVCLQKLHRLAINGKLPVRCADNARGHGSAQLAQRISDGDCHIADLQLVAVAVYRRGQARCLDLEHRDIVR